MTRVVRLRQRGVPRERRDINHESGVAGDLYVEEHHDEVLGRTLKIARLASREPLDTPLLPPLRAVELLWVGTFGFVLAGFERDGAADFAQSWWCRVDQLPTATSPSAATSTGRSRRGSP